MVNVIGGGQIAKEFNSRKRLESALVFASGVADSNCVNENFFDRERRLLKVNLELANTSNKVFIYFSSCALSADNYELNRYYKHKQEMEKIIKNMTDRYLILRVPQLLGEIKRHPTLINFLYYNILDHKQFTVYSNAYRYVIDISDLYTIVNEFLAQGIENKTLDVGNPFRYSVLDIIGILEQITQNKANYDVVKKEDGYILDFGYMLNKIDLGELGIPFSGNYLYNRLSTKINPSN